MKNKIELELDRERQVMIVRFFAASYPGLEREYPFSNDAYLVRKMNGELILHLAAWLAEGTPPP